MKMDAVYEIVDFREGEPLAGVGSVDVTPGGDLRIDRTDGYGETIALDDEHPEGLVDDEHAGTIDVIGPGGRIHLRRLSLADYDQIRSTYGLPEFSSDKAMTSGLLALVAANVPR